MKYFRRRTQHLRQNFLFGFLAVGLFLVLPALTLAAPGDLDPTFGNGGKITTGFSFADAAGVAVHPQEVVETRIVTDRLVRAGGGGADRRGAADFAWDRRWRRRTSPRCAP